MRMKSGKGLFADLDMRTRGSLRGGKLDDVGHWGKEFRGFRWSGGIDQGLAGVRRVDRIRVDALARMVGVHTFLGGRRVRLRFWRRCGLRAWNIEKRQVLDRARPGELRVVKSRIVPRNDRKVWPRENHEGDVQQGRSEDSAAGKAPLHAAISKDKSVGNGLRQMGALEERGYTAEKILMEAAPSDFELRLYLAREDDVGRVEFCLTEQVVRIDVESRRHKV